MGALQTPWAVTVHKAKRGSLNRGEWDVHAACSVVYPYKLAEIYFDLSSPSWLDGVNTPDNTARHELGHVILAPLTHVMSRILDHYIEDPKTKEMLQTLLSDAEEDVVTQIERMPALEEHDSPR